MAWPTRPDSSQNGGYWDRERLGYLPVRPQAPMTWPQAPVTWPQAPVTWPQAHMPTAYLEPFLGACTISPDPSRETCLSQPLHLVLWELCCQSLGSLTSALRTLPIAPYFHHLHSHNLNRFNILHCSSFEMLNSNIPSF